MATKAITKKQCMAQDGAWITTGGKSSCSGGKSRKSTSPSKNAKKKKSTVTKAMFNLGIRF